MVNWDRKRGCTCFNRDAGDLCGCSPVIYRRSDKKLFAVSYTFQYTIDDRNDFEIFVTQNAHTNIFSDSIKQFDIGFTIDTRDTVFIDRSRTFLDPVLVTVLFEWKSKTNEDISLVMKDPSGNIFARMSIENFEDIPIVDIMFPEITTECMIGIWSMDLVSNRLNHTLASLDFLIVSVKGMKKDHNNNWNIDIETVDSFWPIAGICSVRKDSNVCSKQEPKIMTIPLEIKDCDQNRWSAFYYDVKTNW
ncbi:unnamed protein product [Rotaria magnacalcarata]|uniref:Uncharacterized protein n=1 Tax=Rotaria magnacalcarata TaxID=392030 RepID=A0A816SK02_9BILA|nr:unnamed protein product [Rotaria magnacalcarata]